MPPDRYEWLHAEQERLARDLYGLKTVGSRWAKYYRWKVGFLLAVLPFWLTLSALFFGRGKLYEAIGLTVFGLIELVIAFLIWFRLKPPRTPEIYGAGWGVSIVGSVMIAAGLIDLLTP